MWVQSSLTSLINTLILYRPIWSLQGQGLRGTDGLERQDSKCGDKVFFLLNFEEELPFLMFVV